MATNVLKNIIFAVIVAAIIWIFAAKDNNDAGLAVMDALAPEKIKIAACPTCFEAAKKLDTEKYRVISTSATVESAVLLASGEADVILAGRTLRSGEAASDFLVLAEGYSFLADRSLTVYADELKNVIIYTDIDPAELKAELPDFSFKQVDDVYKYLKEGIVLTSWENTDYSRAQIVHVIERDGSRLAMSRRPTLYCPSECDRKIAEDVKSVFD